jgi:hypothetical protein
MKKENSLKEGDTKWVVDYWGTVDGSRAFETEAIIVDVGDEYIGVELYGDSYQIYRKSDYGIIIFDNEKEAHKVAQGLPIPGTTIYTLSKDNKILKRTVTGVDGHYDRDGMYELCLRVFVNKKYPIKELGVSLFLDKDEVHMRKASVKQFVKQKQQNLTY